jgi:excisionase family DNA binding protein
MVAEAQNDFLTVDEAAALVGLSHWTIRKYAKDGKLQRYVRLSRVVISREELLALVTPKKAEGQAK